MSDLEWIWPPLVGGVMIGTASVLYLWLNGRMAGVSGLLAGAMTRNKDRNARLAFVMGLVVGGFLMRSFYPDAFVIEIDRPVWLLLATGFMVGFGAVLGNGCTSGHGICGLGRLSFRSFVSVGVFLTVGFITASLTGGLSW